MCIPPPRVSALDEWDDVCFPLCYGQDRFSPLPWREAWWDTAVGIL